MVKAAYHLASSKEARALLAGVIDNSDRGPLESLKRALEERVHKLEVAMKAAALEEQVSRWEGSGCLQVRYSGLFV